MRAGSNFPVWVTTSGRSVRAAPKSPQTSSQTPRSYSKHRAPVAPRLSVFFRNSSDSRRYTWLIVADKVTTKPVGTRYSSAFSDVPVRTGFESRTDVCQQDTDKYA